MSCFCKNLDTTSGPNVKDTPRSFSLQPVISLSGSDQSKSHKRPVWSKQGSEKTCQGIAFRSTNAITNVPVSGTSVGLITLRICSILCRSGLNPPCIVKIFSSMMAAMGRQLKQSVKVFHNLILYRRLPRQVRKMLSAQEHTLIHIPACSPQLLRGTAFLMAKRRPSQNRQGTPQTHIRHKTRKSY
jgi:hypothetical protein